jgi:hypothetical protein
MKQRTIAIAAGVLTLALATAVTVAVGTSHRLSSSRDLSEAAWHDVAAIHAARARSAKAALDAAAPTTNVELLRQVRTELDRTLAAPPDATVLDDLVSINAYKQQQGELTGKLFMLVAGDVPAPLQQLRAQLPRDEAALAQARARYRQASADYNALSRTTIASLLGYHALPDGL